MQMTIKVTGMADVQMLLKGIREKAPTILAKSLTLTAKAVRDGLKQEMQRVFDRPVPWTLNSLRLETATASKLQAAVHNKDEFGMTAGKGTPAYKYLAPQIFGGERNVKRFELALRYRGVLPPDMYVVPGRYCELDAYGNMSAGQIRQILSYFSSAEMTAGYTMNMTGKRRARLAKGTKKQAGFVYLVNPKWNRGLAPGVYKRLTNAWHSPLFSIMIFVRKPSYKPRFDFFGKGEEIANREWQAIFDSELDRELEKMK